MEWLEVHIDTNHAGLEPLEIFLSANGVDGVVIDDEQDFQSFLENNHQYWDYVDEDLEASMKGKSRITFYLPADGDGFDQLAHLRTALQLQGRPCRKIRHPPDDAGKSEGRRLGKQLEAVL